MRTLDSIEWGVEAFWVLADQWMAIPKIQRMTHAIEIFCWSHGLLCHLQKQLFHLIYYGSEICLGKLIDGVHVLQCRQIPRDILWGGEVVRQVIG